MGPFYILRLYILFLKIFFYLDIYIYNIFILNFKKLFFILTHHNNLKIKNINFKQYSFQKITKYYFFEK